MLKLPVDAIRARLEAALAEGPVVLTAPTGSGKSTRVPVWLAESGPVVVVEPRRIAARALGSIVAEQTGARIGKEVGWIVRDDVRATDATRLRFVTPGIALRMVPDGRLDGVTVVLDEFHERTLDMDLLLGLLAERSRRLVLLSATIDAKPLAAWLGGTALEAEGRRFPVHVHHLGSNLLPEVRGVEERVVRGVHAALEHEGDVLVFLPGRGEIRDVERRLSGDFDIVALHGSLSLKDQQRALKPGPRRRVVLATNVAETSLTVPGIGIVVDSGLVRQTRYHQGRGHLALLPIALDSAEQRSGRAGRLGPGVAIRLWEADRHLEARTKPEVHRESLVSLVLAASAAGVDPRRLRLPDPPKAYALDDAIEELTALGAVDATGITERGRRLFTLPVDAALAQLLVVAEERGTIGDVVDLVAALACPRRLFIRPAEPDHDLAAPHGCDAQALVRAVREGRREHGLSTDAVREARALAKRLRDAFGAGPGTHPLDRRALADTLLAAWPRCAYLPRRRKRRVAWANGGTELALGRDVSAPEDAPALLALDSRASGVGRDRAVRMTAAMPVAHAWLVEAGRGTDRIARVAVERRQVIAVVERVYAGSVIGTRSVVPEGELAVAAVAELIARNTLFKGVAATFKARRRRWQLGHRVGLVKSVPEGLDEERWFAWRLEQAGMTTVDELDLLSAEDLLPDDVPALVREELERTFPQRLDIGTHVYTLDYEPHKRLVTLVRTRGPKGAKPPAQYLPRLQGWKVVLKEASNIVVLRGR